MAMDLTTRNQAAHTLLQHLSHLLPRDDENWTKILLGMMQLFYDADVLCFTLGRIRGGFPEMQENSVVHRALAMKLFITDPIAAGMVVRKTSRGGLHRFWGKEHSGVPPGTPMSLAMYQPRLFFGWVRVLRDVGLDLGEFLKEELEGERSVLKGEGWDVDALMEVVGLQADEGVVKSTSGCLKCERCGRAEGSSWLKVDLAWRWRLMDLRKRQRAETSAVRYSTISDPSNETEAIPMSPMSPMAMKTTPLKVISFYDTSGLERLPYGIVCSDECQDGICVAWVFEERSTADILSPLVDHPNIFAKVPTPGQTNTEISGIAVTKCQIKRMPGAFVD